MQFDGTAATAAVPVNNKIFSAPASPSVGNFRSAFFASVTGSLQHGVQIAAKFRLHARRNLSHPLRTQLRHNSALAQGLPQFLHWCR